MADGADVVRRERPRSQLYIAVGDDEYKNPKAIDATHDLDFEAHVVYLGKPPATPMQATITGTAGDDRAGGIATDASGNVCQAGAAAGALDG